MLLMSDMLQLVVEMDGVKLRCKLNLSHLNHKLKHIGHQNLH